MKEKAKKENNWKGKVARELYEISWIIKLKKDSKFKTKVRG